MNDLIIIGAGPGGYELALEARKFNLSTVLIEKAEVGGTCLNCGCIPTKSYYKNAEFLKSLNKANKFGVNIVDYSFDFKKALDRKDEIVTLLKGGVETSLNKAGVNLIKGSAKLVNKNTVMVDNEMILAKNIVIATGSSPIMIPNFNDALSSTELLALEELPQKLVIIGGGVIGLEFASIFNAFGTKVEVVEMLDKIIPNVDYEVSKRLMAYLKTSGIKFHLNSQALSYDNKKVLIKNKNGELIIECDQVLVSVGRKPNIDGLGLEELDIVFDKKGIKVDENFKTNIDNIYAIGDVNGKNMLAHYATFSGYHVLNHILGVENKINFNLIPASVFTFPEVAVVGLTEELCEGLNYKVHKSLYRANGKAQTMDETDGYVKIITIDDSIVGVHIIGESASVLIHEMSSLMNNGITLKAFKNIIHAHPTLSEIYLNTIEN